MKIMSFVVPVQRGKAHKKSDNYSFIYKPYILISWYLFQEELIFDDKFFIYKNSKKCSFTHATKYLTFFYCLFGKNGEEVSSALCIAS